MKHLILVVLILSLSIGRAVAQPLFRAFLDASTVIPPVTSPGVGEVNVNWAGTAYWDIYRYHVEGHFTALVGTPQRLILARGNPGIGSEAIFEFTEFGGPVEYIWIPDTTIVFTPTDYEDFIGERLHVLVVTDSFPSGEIAGMIRSRPDPVTKSTWGRVRALYR